MVTSCPACGCQSFSIFYSVDNIPVHSVRLIRTRDEALHFKTGKMDLAHCPTCGFIFNCSYLPELQDYSAEYESTQAYSPTFNSFAGRLAQSLVRKFDLHNRNIIEIGCGQGEFLSLLCEYGNNRGIGFDPAFDPNRSSISNDQKIKIIPDYYSENYSAAPADFICCKMTLEHIQGVAHFVKTVRRSIGDRYDTTVFFQVPDIHRVLTEVAFWDIYYEHCSYFSTGSLGRLFRQQGFFIKDIWRDYGDQYLMIEARAAYPDEIQPPLPNEDDFEKTKECLKNFSTRIPDELHYWKNIIQESVRAGKKITVWGSGSKAVAFLTTLGIRDEIIYSVDINPNKQQTYLAGTGQEVVLPQFLSGYYPDLVILMNPLYRNEVQTQLTTLGLAPRMLAVGE